MLLLPMGTASRSAVPSPFRSPAATRAPTSLLLPYGEKPERSLPLTPSSTWSVVQHPASRPSTISSRPSPLVSPVAMNAPAHQAASLYGRSVVSCLKLRPSKTLSSVHASLPGAVTISGRPSPLTSPTATRTPCWYVSYAENSRFQSPHGANCCANRPLASQPRTSGQPASCPVTICGAGGAAFAAPATTTVAARVAIPINAPLRDIARLPS